MNAPMTLAILLATGCGGLSPLGEGPATDSGDTGSSEVVVGSLSATPGSISRPRAAPSTARCSLQRGPWLVTMPLPSSARKAQSRP